MTKRSSLIFFLLPVFALISSHAFAQKGKDGAETVTATVQFNRYTTLASTAVAGATAIVVGDITALGAGNIPGAVNNPYQTAALSAGDLLMILKMQGASIDQTNTTNYGSIVNYNGVGVHELIEVGRISGDSIYVANGCALANGYTVTAFERVQVIRVPRLANLTINAGGSLTAPAWNTMPAVYTGGVVAIEVTGNLVNQGSINAQGKGFLGGQNEDSSNMNLAVVNYVSNDPYKGAEKGESIAGNRFDYKNAMSGEFCMGAPANGGGGGNAHNAGGGGGANGNNGNIYNGKGIPDPNAAYTAAWAQEVPSFTSNITSGGGRGGYTYSDANENALVTGPGNALWLGDRRKNEGGFGGRPLNAVNGSRLFFGGGGGAGDANGAPISTLPGGSGGGIIYVLVSGNVSGSGTINASADDAPNSNNTGSDGMGGGGGGGSVVLLAAGTITQVAISANGGKSGDQNLGQVAGDRPAEGPGGGGGGGCGPP